MDEIQEGVLDPDGNYAEGFRRAITTQSIERLSDAALASMIESETNLIMYQLNSEGVDRHSYAIAEKKLGWISGLSRILYNRYA